MGTSGPGDDDDPGARLPLDDDVVRRALRRELTAEERIERLRRIDSEHRRLLDEARAAVQPAEQGSPHARWRRRVLVLLIVVALGAVATWSVLYEDGRRAGVALSAPTGDRDAPVVVDDAPVVVDGAPAAVDEVPPAPDVAGGPAVAATQPSRSAEQQDAPLGAPAPLAVESAAHQFMGLQPGGGGPIAYDPCRPIHVVVNARTAPPGADAMLAAALAEVRLATGLRFTMDGPTDEAPTPEREAFQPDRYGDRWAPVLVAWSDPTEVAGLTGDIAGQGGSTWLELPRGASVYVTGTVVLDGPQLAESVAAPGSEDGARLVVQHEIAHLVGLGHIEDPAELMQPVAQPGVDSFGPGDLTGLAALGRGGCFPDV